MKIPPDTQTFLDSLAPELKAQLEQLADADQKTKVVNLFSFVFFGLLKRNLPLDQAADILEALFDVVWYVSGGELTRYILDAPELLPAIARDVATRQLKALERLNTLAELLKAPPPT
jgi:hypothetical protein